MFISKFKIFLLTAFILTATFVAKAQTDTLFSNNQKIACTVKEITPEAVKYSLPGEDLVNSVYKNTIQKIIFKNGRIQTFAEASSYKPVNGVMDFEQVTITSVENEVKGLYKLADVSSKAKGTTVYSSQEKVKDRAYRKIKIQAAMFGANTILLSNQRTEGNKYGYYSSSSTETNLTGIAYSNIIPDYDKFKQLVGAKTDFKAVKKFELGASDSDVSQDDINKVFHVVNIENNNGIIIIHGDIKGENDNKDFQLANYTENSFSIAYKHKGDAYNLVLSL